MNSGQIFDFVFHQKQVLLFSLGPKSSLSILTNFGFILDIHLDKMLINFGLFNLILLISQNLKNPKIIQGICFDELWMNY